MILKVAIFNILWFFIGSAFFYLLQIKNDEIIGAWVLILIIGIGLLAGLLKENSHDQLFEVKKHNDSKSRYND